MLCHQGSGFSEIGHFCSLYNYGNHKPIRVNEGPTTRFHWGGGCKSCVSAAGVQDCPFCKAKMSCHIDSTTSGTERDNRVTYREKIFICHECGWWKATSSRNEESRGGIPFSSAGNFAQCAVLKPMPISAPEALLAYLRLELQKQPHKRYELDPWKFEEVVASIFRDNGYRVLLTGKTRDGGVDIYLWPPDETDPIAVQVKRTANKVSLHLIQALFGAAVMGRAVKAIFVTTSEFSEDAKKAAATFHQIHGMEIDLVDGLKFQELLEVAQIKQIAKPTFEDFGIIRNRINYQCLWEESFKG